MIIYVESTKNQQQKFLQLISTLNKVAGYKVNIYKSIAFLYNSKE